MDTAPEVGVATDLAGVEGADTAGVTNAGSLGSIAAKPRLNSVSRSGSASAITRAGVGGPLAMCSGNARRAFLSRVMCVRRDFFSSLSIHAA